MFGFFSLKKGRQPVLSERTQWLNLRIRWITEGALIPEQQLARARVVAGQMDAADFDLIPAVLRLEFSAPTHLKEQFSEFCSWADTRFESAFLMLKESGAPAMSALRRIALGEYDWQQGMALGVLAELAAQGIEADATAQLVSRELKYWRYETVLRGLNGICKFAACNDKVADALLDLAADWGKDDTIEELGILEPLSVFAPRVAEKRQSVLYSLLDEGGRGVPRTPFQEGFVVTENGEPFGELPEVSGLTDDYHAIRAALALQRIYPDRPELREQLEHLRDHHANSSLRDELSDLLAVISGRGDAC